MSYDPFDGVLLDDARPPVPGAFGLLLHLRVARRLAKTNGWPAPSLDALKARAGACQELLAQGLLPATLRALQGHGLELGNPRSPHSLAAVLAHLEAYLAEVDRAGYLEPDQALWRAVDLQLQGGRGLWIERTPEDGPILAGLRDLSPARLRALACVPELGGATFALATRKGDGSSGLFGSSQPLVEWFLDGLEQHGQSFPNELDLTEPAGWGDAPWSPELAGLFEGALALEAHGETFQRSLVEGPVDLLRHAVEQICSWLDEGFTPAEITVIHPEPQKVAPFLAPLLAAEGIPLQVRGGLLPLLASEAWSPLWTLLTGLQRLDPCAVSAGLRASHRDDLRRWADLLAVADQTGPRAFTSGFMHLHEWARPGATATWQELDALRQRTLPARDWAARLEGLAGTLRLPMDPDDFFAPLGLLKEAWTIDVWTFAEMLTALEAFLQAARSSRGARAPEGLRLVTPDTLLEEWSGSRATLILDLSEGAWPSRAAENPDLDWDRKAAINQTLVQATVAAGDAVFPLALQRFWLPRSEHGDQIPRAFQREAYAFNKVLAMTQERLLVLSPAQDEEGRMKAQGPFWNALEGAAPWVAPAKQVSSRLRWLWEGHELDPLAEARSQATLARPEADALTTPAPAADLIPGVRAAWLNGQPGASPTALESLAKCPFRSLAERVWRLTSDDAASRLRMARGTLVHHLLETTLLPYVGLLDWPAAFLGDLGGELDPEAMLLTLRALWEANRETWLAGLSNIPQEQWPQVVLEVEALLPNLAAALLLDGAALTPTKDELAFLYPERMAVVAPKKGPKMLPLQEGWTRTLVALEAELGPVALELPDGRPFPVSGKLDRIERWDHEEGLSFLRVLDYKTSTKKSLDAFAEEDAPFAAHLQTPLYMLMAEATYPDIVATAALLPLREESPEPFTKHLSTLAAVPGEPGAWRGRLLQNLARFDARLEAGDFPPTPGEHCSWCELSALCGRPVDVTVDSDEEGD